MFKKAEKNKTLMRMCIIAPSGAGKTYSMLSIGSGIAKNINSRLAIINAGPNSGEFYADKFDFDIINIPAPYNPANFIEALQIANNKGYKIVGIDSASYAWEWITDKVDDLTYSQYQGNVFRAWIDGRKLYRRFMDAIMYFPGHIISTIRSRQEWNSEDGNKDKFLLKQGAGLQSHKNTEFEYTIILEGQVDHSFIVTTDHTGAFQDRVIFMPGIEFGQELIKSMLEGKDLIVPKKIQKKEKKEPEQNFPGQKEEEKPKKNEELENKHESEKIEKQPVPKQIQKPEKNTEIYDKIIKELEKKDLLRFYQKEYIYNMPEEQQKQVLGFVKEKLEITGLEFDHLICNMKEIHDLGGNPVLEKRFEFLKNFLQSFICNRNKFAVLVTESADFLKKVKSGEIVIEKEEEFEDENSLDFDSGDIANE